MKRACYWNGILALTVLSGSAQAQLTYDTLLVSGEHAPGTAAGVVFTFFDFVEQANDGSLRILARVEGPGVTSANSTGVWVGQPGSLELIAREGDQAMGLPAGITIREIQNHPGYASDGLVAVEAEITGPGVIGANNYAVWAGYPGSMQLVVREGDQVPGMPQGVIFGAQSTPAPIVLGDTGTIAFTRVMEGPGITSLNSTALWLGSPMNPILILQRGDPAPGLPFQTTFIGFTITRVMDTGAVLFGGGLNTQIPQLPGSWHVASYLVSDSQIEPIYVTGETPPGAPSGFIAWSIGPLLNTQGQMGLIASLQDTNSVASMSGVWSRESETLQLVSLGNTRPPGTAPGTKIRSHDRHGFAESGLSIFHANLFGAGVNTGNDTGLWMGRANRLRLLAREGADAPGMPIGVRFNRFDLSVFETARNGTTQIVATLFDPVNGDRPSLWVGVPGQFFPIAYRGLQIELAPGDVRTVRGITPNRNWSRQVGDEFMFGAGFDGGTGAVLRVTLPSISFCFVDCDESTGSGNLDLFDFLCFQSSFVSGDPYACNCDTSTGPLVCDLFDFLCFQDAFVAGCP